MLRARRMHHRHDVEWCGEQQLRAPEHHISMADVYGGAIDEDVSHRNVDALSMSSCGRAGPLLVHRGGWASVCSYITSASVISSRLS